MLVFLVGRCREVPGGIRASKFVGLVSTRLCQVARLLVFLRIFLYNAKPSFEIAKWMAKNMLWQNMKINKFMQKNLATQQPTSLEYLHQKGGGREAAAPLLVQIFARCWFLGFLFDFVDFHILSQHMFCLLYTSPSPRDRG